MSRSQKNSTISRPADGPIAFVPAAPGWHVIAPIYDGYSCDGVPSCELMKLPIVAWKIETHTCRDGSTFTSTAPITPELERDHECLEYAGHYYIVEENDFATEQEVIAYFNKREAKRRKAEEARAGAEAGAQ